MVLLGDASAGPPMSGNGAVSKARVSGPTNSTWSSRGTPRLAGPEAVEQAVRGAVEPFTADDGSVTLETNLFIFVVGQA